MDLFDTIFSEFTDGDNAVTDVINVDPGTLLSIQWEVSSGVCTPKSDDLTIFRPDNLTIPVVDNDTTLCADAPLVVRGSTPLSTENGLWLTSGTGTFSSGALSPVGSYVASDDDIASGSVTLIWTIDNEVCDSLSADMVVSYDLVPTSADAGIDLEECDGPITVSGNNPLVGTAEWSVIPSTAATATMINDSSAIISGMATPTTLTLQYEISNGVCPSSRETMNLSTTGFVTPQINIFLTEDTICENEEVTISSDQSFGGTSPSVAWILNGDTVERVLYTFALDTLKENATLSVVYTSSLTCVTDPEASDNVNITVFSPPTPDLTLPDSAICRGNVVSIDAITSGGAIQWYNTGVELQGETSDPLLASNNGTYYFSEDNGVCPEVFSDSVEITVNEFPVVSIKDGDRPREMFLGDTERLQGEVFLNGETYDENILWTPILTIEDPTVLEALATPVISGYIYYTLTADNQGCVSSDSVQLVVREPIDIPNTFTPNDDSFNDTWVIRGLDTYEDARVVVYNRWGSLVYEGRGTYQAWNGQRNGEGFAFGDLLLRH